jgi:hypothetical protein
METAGVANAPMHEAPFAAAVLEAPVLLVPLAAADPELVPEGVEDAVFVPLHRHVSFHN